MPRSPSQKKELDFSKEGDLLRVKSQELPCMKENVKKTNQIYVVDEEADLDDEDDAISLEDSHCNPVLDNLEQRLVASGVCFTPFNEASRSLVVKQ